MKYDIIGALFDDDIVITNEVKNGVNDKLEKGEALEVEC